MPNADEKVLLDQFQHFTLYAFADGSLPHKRMPGRFFERAEGDLTAKIERDDFITPTSLGSRSGLLEAHWLAARFGTWLNYRYYLAAVRIEGNFETQQITYTSYEYRFAGLYKLRRNPLHRRRILPPLPVSEVVLHYNPSVLPCWGGIDTNWTGRERRTDIVRVLESFGKRLNF